MSNGCNIGGIFTFGSSLVLSECEVFVLRGHQKMAALKHWSEGLKRAVGFTSQTGSGTEYVIDHRWFAIYLKLYNGGTNVTSPQEILYSGSIFLVCHVEIFHTAENKTSKVNIHVSSL